MERTMYDLLAGVESSWWYRGRSELVRRLLRAYAPGIKGMTLDVGAGFGPMFPLLKPYGEVVAYEPDAIAAEACLARGYAQVLLKPEDLQALEPHFVVVGMFDVLEHVEDDIAFLKILRGILKDGGILALTVPAWPFLWSQHDKDNRHFRRYTKKELRRVLEAGGFDVAYIGFWNMCLFLPAAVGRLLGRSGASTLKLARPLDMMLRTLVLAENRLIPLFRLPFGLSLTAVVRKRDVH